MPAVLLLLGWLSLASVLRADDAVTLVASSPGADPVVVRGTIVDYTGTQLTLRTASGESTIASSKVAAVQTDYPESFVAARRQIAAGNSTDALPLLKTAFEQETRGWVRHEIMAATAVALHNVGRSGEAGTMFLQIAAADPATRHVEAMPLIWWLPLPNLQRDQIARQWINESSPHAQLLGASWLLASADRQQALTVLGRLRNSPDSRLAILAEAQLWQTEIVTAKLEQVRQWQTALDRGILSGPALAGPLLVVGRALRQLKQYDEAALVLLRPPILYPQQREIGGQCLLNAACSLSASGNKDECRRVAQEILTSYATHSVRQEAEAILRQLSTGTSN